MVIQLGDHFIRQARNLLVIEIQRQHGVLIALLFFDLFLLASNITFVFYLDLNLLGCLSIGQRRRKCRDGGQLGVIHFRAAQQFFTVGFTRQRCFQQRVHLLDVFGVRVHPDVAQALTFLFDVLEFFAKACPAGIVHQAQFAAFFRQAQIGIVFT
ncbi:hypothetical protein D3C80_1674000 [compost metagenome]